MTFISLSAETDIGYKWSSDKLGLSRSKLPWKLELYVPYKSTKGQPGCPAGVHRLSDGSLWAIRQLVFTLWRRHSSY